jgi:hypothetical protein
VTLWYVDQIVHQSFEVRLERTHSEQFGVQRWSRRKDPRGFSDTRENFVALYTTSVTFASNSVKLRWMKIKIPLSLNAVKNF